MTGFIKKMDQVRLNLLCEHAIEKVYDENIVIDQDLDSVPNQGMVSRKRNLVTGLHREPQFGPILIFGLGRYLHKC